MVPVIVTNIKINKVRNVKNIEIPLADGKIKHLIITGKNGSGKPRLLEAMQMPQGQIIKTGKKAHIHLFGGAKKNPLGFGFHPPRVKRWAPRTVRIGPESSALRRPSSSRSAASSASLFWYRIGSPAASPEGAAKLPGIRKGSRKKAHPSPSWVMITGSAEVWGSQAMWIPNSVKRSLPNPRRDGES